MIETEVFFIDVVTVAMQTQKESVTRFKSSRRELFERAEFMINLSRNLTVAMTRDGFIKDCSVAVD